MKQLLTSFAFLVVTFMPLHAQDEYPVPVIPDTITNIEARAGYAVMHYWEHFNFSDTTLLHKGSYAEQALSNFIGLLGYASQQQQEKAVRQWVDAITPHPVVFNYFAETTEQYLFQTDSPLHNDSLYCLTAVQLLQSPACEEAFQTRTQFHLQLIHSNQPGHQATDFRYETLDGKRHKLLSDTGQQKTLLLFYDPDCENCKDLLFRLRHSSLLKQQISEGTIRMLAISTEDDEVTWRAQCSDMPNTWILGIDRSDILGQSLYDLRQLPAMYLLDSKGNVLFKHLSYQELMTQLTR